MRRIGTSPAERGCGENNSCPDVIETDDGDFLAIGRYAFLLGSQEERAMLLARLEGMGASIGEDETAVIVPRECLLAAAKQLVAEGQI